MELVMKIINFSSMFPSESFKFQFRKVKNQWPSRNHYCHGVSL